MLNPNIRHLLDQNLKKTSYEKAIKLVAFICHFWTTKCHISGLTVRKNEHQLQIQ